MADSTISGGYTVTGRPGRALSAGSPPFENPPEKGVVCLSTLPGASPQAGDGTNEPREEPGEPHVCRGERQGMQQLGHHVPLVLPGTLEIFTRWSTPVHPFHAALSTSAQLPAVAGSTTCPI